MKLKNNTCKRCGRQFMSIRKRSFCFTCWGTLSAKKEFTCDYCGKKFKRYYSQKRLETQKLFFCGKHCRSVYYWSKIKFISLTRKGVE